MQCTMKTNFPYSQTQKETKYVTCCWRHCFDLFQMHVEITYVKDQYCKMDIVGNIVFGFFMLKLDTLYLKTFYCRCLAKMEV